MAYTKIISGIYSITCRATGEAYVGSSEHVLARWVTHRSQLKRGIHHSKGLQARWDRYGIEGFEFAIVEEVAETELLKRERSFVISGRFVFNALIPVRNPMKGRRHTAESRALMSANRKGKPGPRAKGVPLTEEHKAALSEAAKKRPHRVGYTLNLTAEQRRELSERMRGKPPIFKGHRHTPETRAKMKAAAAKRDRASWKRGAEHPSFGKSSWNRGIPALRGAAAPSAKPITIGATTYPSTVDAAAALGVCVSTIVKRRARGPEDLSRSGTSEEKAYLNLNDIKIDPAKLEDGAWVADLPNMGDLELKVRGVGNRLYRTREAALLKGVRRSKRGELDIGDSDRITTTLLLETVLLDWRGIVDGDQPVPYSREMAEKLLTDPAWRNFRAAVAYAGAIVAQETAADQDANAKN